ncbi:hypothetical protein [Nesterenkonia marinintestina]|uniref:hypothetical protein n=1 Tax=Nesterenkonia marinintestina TaxID=2979865 RepID=UPI0021C13F6C|nr:hypothetical protein [Nesterenkonia sp. GX14115]
MKEPIEFTPWGADSSQQIDPDTGEMRDTDLDGASGEQAGMSLPSLTSSPEAGSPEAEENSGEEGEDGGQWGADLPGLADLPDLADVSGRDGEGESVQSPRPDASLTTLRRYRHEDLEAEMEAEADPEWLGRRWRELESTETQHALVGLRRWVDWLVCEHSLNSAIVPACWFRHPAIVAELYAAMNMEHKAWAEGEPTVQPMMMWLPHLEQMKVRLRELVAELAGCADGTHVEEERQVRVYNEDLWRATVYTYRESQHFTRPAGEDELRFVKATAFSAAREEIGATGIKALRPRVGAHQPSTELRMEKTTGVADSELILTISGTEDVDHVVWEEAESPEGPWRHVTTD